MVLCDTIYMMLCTVLAELRLMTKVHWLCPSMHLQEARPTGGARDEGTPERPAPSMRAMMSCVIATCRIAFWVDCIFPVACARGRQGSPFLAIGCHVVYEHRV